MVGHFLETHTVRLISLYLSFTRSRSLSFYKYINSYIDPVITLSIYVNSLAII
jgi:hypothetical protein